MPDYDRKELAQRLRDARDKSGVRNYQIADACNVSPQAVNGWLSTGKIAAEHIGTIARLLNVTSDWLLTGRDYRAVGNVSSPKEVQAKVPLISWVQAGAWTEIIDNFEPGDADEWIDAPFNVGENSFALTVHGDSMQPEFAEGDVIIVDPQRRPENGSYVVARLDDEAESTFKQLQIDGGRKYLKPLNPRYPVLQVNGDMTICGVVRAKTKLY